ncbi:hypothetical protein JRQ81_005070, partial [Phrynocephalus forsythii]
ELPIGTHCQSEYQEIGSMLSQKVEVKELDDARYYLGIQIERKADGSLLLSQKQKIIELLYRLGLQEANTYAK